MSVHLSQQGAGAPSNILERVRQCAAAVTRYPLDILTGDAQLEDELGIDSVKLAEIAAVVSREFNLPPERLPRGGKARTLGAIAGLVTEVIAESPAAPTRVVPVAVPVAAPPVPSAPRWPTPPSATASRSGCSVTSPMPPAWCLSATSSTPRPASR